MKFLQDLFKLLFPTKFDVASVGPALGAGGIVQSPKVSALGTLGGTTTGAFSPIANLNFPEASAYNVVFDSPGAATATGGYQTLYPDGVTWSATFGATAIGAGVALTINVPGPLLGIRPALSAHAGTGTINAFVVAL